MKVRKIRSFETEEQLSAEIVKARANIVNLVKRYYPDKTIDALDPDTAYRTALDYLEEEFTNKLMILQKEDHTTVSH